MVNFLNQYIFSLDEQGRKPTILVNIADDDITRGDTAGRKGLAQEIAQKIDGEVLYADIDKLDNIYPGTENDGQWYDDKLEQYLSEHRIPDIVLGKPCYSVLKKFGKDAENMLYITEYNESISASSLGEKNIVAHHLTNDMLKEEGEKFDKAYPNLKKPIIAVFLVNPEAYTQNDFISRLSSISKQYKETTIFLCGSRRTLKDNYLELKSGLEKSVPDSVQIEGFQFDRDAKFNPYRGLIARADHFVLWGQSMSMMSEPLITGKTVHLYNYSGISNDLVQRGVVSDFYECSLNEPLPTKSFPPFNITEKLADKLLSRFKGQNGQLIKKKEAFYKEKKLPQEWHSHLIKICIDHNHINNVPKEIRQNKKFIKYALGENGMALQHMEEKIRKNTQASKVAIANKIQAIDFADPSILDDTDAMEYVLKHVMYRDYIDLYDRCSDRLKSCHDFNLGLLDSHVDIASRMDKDLFKHQDICLSATTVSNTHAEKISKELWNDEKFTKKILDTDIHSFRYLPEEKRADSKYLDLILEKCSYLIQFSPQEIRDDEDIMIKFIKNDNELFSCASRRLRTDVDFLVECFKITDISYDVPDKMWEEKKVALAALDHSYENFVNCHNTALANDFDLCKKTLEQNKEAWYMLRPESKKNPDLCLIVAEKYSSLWADIDKTIRKDKDFLLKCVALPKFSIKKIDPELLTDDKFVKDIIRIRPEWKNKPELTNSFNATQYKNKLSTAFNIIKTPVKAIVAFKKKFKQEQKM